ncbi:hypothetical protein PO909_033074, partial [Leuciscus waleckii]
DPPNAPRWLEVVNITKINCDLKWTEPDSDGGSPITNYVVEKRDVRRRAWQAVDTTVKDTKYTVTPLNEGSLYVFRVAAENAVGVSEFSELEDSVLAKDTFSKLNCMYILCVPKIDLELTSKQLSLMLQMCLIHHVASKPVMSKSYGHFDIRPENIVYTTRKGTNVKIIELGQSRHLTPGEQIKIQYTTAEFAAPEIHQNEMVSTVTDMWSVGVLVYVLLSGLNPFAAETNQQMIESIYNAEYSFDDEAFKHVSVEALDFVDRLLTKERKHPEKVIKTASPEKTCPRSPSLDSTEKTITTPDLSTKIDYMSRYESRKKALKTERKFEIVTQQPFTLDHAPRVTVRMRSHRVPIGQNTKFTLNVQSKPEAQIKWYHNGQEIEESRKYRMFNMSGVLSLQIIDCQEEDSGTYRVVCTNAKGEASDYATLDVAGGGFSAYASQRKDEEPPTPFVPEMTKTDVYHVSSITAATASETQVEISETKTERAEETIKTSEIKLEAVEVTAVEEVVVEKMSETKLEVTEVTTVVEEVVEKKKQTPATILTKPQSLTVSEGESVKFTCDVDGEPAPTVTWMQEGQVIVSSRRHHVTSTEYKSTFEITQVEMSDGGNYTVVAENSDGKQEAQFSLTIRKPTPVQKVVASPPRVKSPESPRIKSPFGIRSPQRIKSPEPIKSPPRVKSPPMVKSPTPKEKTSKPTFSAELKDISASADTIIKLIVKLSGEPKPTIFWMKDGKVRNIFLLYKNI